VLLSEAVELLEPSAARLDAALALIELGTALVEKKTRKLHAVCCGVAPPWRSLCGARHLVEEAGTQLRAAGARTRRLGTVGIASLTRPRCASCAWLPRARRTNGSPTSLRHRENGRGPPGQGLPQARVDSRRDLAEALERSERKGDTLMKPGTPEECSSRTMSSRRPARRRTTC